MSGENVLRIVDETTGQEIERCAGPSADGSCPRVTIGDVLPCAGHVLVPAAVGDQAVPYAVSGEATLCPVTVAVALAVTPDNLLSLTPLDGPGSSIGRRSRRCWTRSP